MLSEAKHLSFLDTMLGPDPRFFGNATLASAGLGAVTQSTASGNAFTLHLHF